MRTMKEVVEEKGKFIKQLEEAVEVDERDFDQQKCDRINKRISQLDEEIKLIDDNNQKLAGSGKKGIELRKFGTREIIKPGPTGDLEKYVSDIVRNEFGMGGVQTRDILEGSGSGQYAVPAPLYGAFISYLMEKSLLGRLKVPSVGVDTDTTTYAQISALPTADVIAEGAELSEDDPTITPRTMTTYSFRAGTIVSQEFLEDAIATPQIILEPITQSIADHIDDMFINGSGSGEPMGLDSMTGVYMRLHLGADGAALTGFEELGALWRKARELNINVSAFVMAPRTLEEYKLLEDANEAPKQNPFAEIPLLETNQVGIADTQGSADNATKIFAGDFTKAVVAGWRYGGSHMKFLVDRTTLAEYGKVRLYGVCRMGLMYPYGYGVFGYVKGVIPPAGAIT